MLSTMVSTWCEMDFLHPQHGSPPRTRRQLLRLGSVGQAGADPLQRRGLGQGRLRQLRGSAVGAGWVGPRTLGTSVGFCEGQKRVG